MTLEHTLCIIKPDAVEKHKIGAILQRIEAAGFRVVALRMMQLTRDQAEGFYEVHRNRPFFAELVRFMTRSPIVAAVLEEQDAVASWRELMGATDPAKAAPDTIRKLFGSNVGENATHGSDSVENARREIAYMFPNALPEGMEVSKQK
jgi:nucleoside-diphosphate kinase